MARVLLIALFSLALTSCWIGTSLYSPTDARTAIPPGVYQAIAPDEPKRVYRITILPSGLTRFDTGEKQEVYGFAPLDRDNFVGWAQVEDAPADAENQMYGLLVRQPGGAFMIYLPECKDEQAEIAREAGAIMEGGTSPACRFPTRVGLEKAMRQLPRDPSQAMRLERVP